MIMWNDNEQKGEDLSKPRYLNKIDWKFRFIIEEKWVVDLNVTE